MQVKQRKSRSTRHTTTVDVYRLGLPSGAVVRICKATPLVLAANGLFSTALLDAAMGAVGPDKEQPTKQAHAVTSIDFVCRACLMDDINPDDMTLIDKMAVHSWATAPGNDGATYESIEPIKAEMFFPLVKGAGAVLLHLACEAYGVRPSVVLGIDVDLELSLALDVAIAYRGLRREQTGGEGEVEAPDMFGDIHKVPANWLSSAQRNGDRPPVHIDDMVKFWGPDTVLSAGGIAGGDGAIGPMPSADGLRHWDEHLPTTH